jgi:protein AFG1
LDEFQVVDIADAMILKGLLEALFKHQVTLLITSNRPPDDLYLNGIQRASFLPCIELIKDRLDVLHMNGLQDYRLRSTPTTATGQYYSVGDMSSLDGLFKELSRNQTVGQLSIPVMGRTITVKRCIGDAAWFDFDDLFRAPLSAVDYLALADIFLTIFIVNVPAFYSSDLRTEARRFVTFIDVLYDKKGRLAVQAQVPLDQLFRLPGQNSSSVEELELADVLNVNRGAALFTGAEEQFAVARAYSRIHQMTSLVWWNDSQRDATAPGP